MNFSKSMKVLGTAAAPPVQSQIGLVENMRNFGGYSILERSCDVHIGKHARHNQLIAAAACSGAKASCYLKEALSCNNVKLIDATTIVVLPKTKEIRVKELTPLMAACIIGNFMTVKVLIEDAKRRLSPSQFDLFINVKTTEEFGGNNALLYACSSTNSNFLIVNYLITHGGAD